MYKVKVGRFTYREGMNEWDAQQLARDLRKIVLNVKVARG